MLSKILIFEGIDSHLSQIIGYKESLGYRESFKQKYKFLRKVNLALKVYLNKIKKINYEI